MRSLEVRTPRWVAFVDITAEVEAAVRSEAAAEGAVLIFVPHTTAGVTLNENADPSVRDDLEMTLARLAPDDLPYGHREGNSDAHVKASLMGSSALVPLHGGRLVLGAWQGVYLAEFDGPRRRSIHVSVLAAR